MFLIHVMLFFYGKGHQLNLTHDNNKSFLGNELGQKNLVNQVIYLLLTIFIMYNLISGYLIKF